MLINDHFLMTLSAWHLCYTAEEGHYLYEYLDSFVDHGYSTDTLQSISESTFHIPFLI